MKKDHWNRSVREFLLPHLQLTERNIKVATGFFSIQGYDLLRLAFAGKSVQILVGFDEYSRERLRKMLIEDIMRHLRQWGQENRREAVLDLVERIKAKRFQIVEHDRKDWIDAKARLKDHAKLYILDDKKVIIGSSNLTKNGLIFNIEGMSVKETPESVEYFIKQYKTYWEAEDTIDLTQVLLDALLAWLKLCSPFDIYLKTISVLTADEPIESPRESYKMPVQYQRVVIERVLRQLKDFRGAMLVASTGLGKTIMATHTALRLRREGVIMNVVVFAPLQVQPEWKHSLRSAGLSYEIFTRNLLDYPPSRKGKKTLEMQNAISQFDKKHLIIIDESQYFRNKVRARDGKKRHAFQRLNKVIVEKKAYVLLLTATPYSKEVSDLNNQLNLLPHTAEKKYIKQDGQTVMPGMIDDKISPQAWKVMDSPGFFEDFMRLPVATVISTSQVAKDFAEKTEEGDYILFGQQKKWIPRVSITKIKVLVLLEKEVSHAISEKVFLHEIKVFPNRNGEWSRSRDTINNLAEIGWMSSPAALQKVVEKTLNDDYKVRFLSGPEKREKFLNPILKGLKAKSYREDPKFSALTLYLKKYYSLEKKVIIFVERLETAVYLERSLIGAIPNISVANTVKQNGDNCELKDFDKDVQLLINGFAPEANADRITDKAGLINYDVLISTDAYSTGVNLQDASVVINYDLAWTPDVLIQRAGRILRFWKTPRQVDFLVLVGDFKENLGKKASTHKVEERLRKLSNRSQHAQKFSEIPILSDAEKVEYESLADLSSVTIERLGLADQTQLEEFTGVSPFLRHLTILKENEDYAASIPDDIQSALTYKGKRELLYLLLKYKEDYFRLIYDIKEQKIDSIKEDALLDLIACKKETPPAAIRPDQIEICAQKARSLWEERQDFDVDEEVERICALYLVPGEREKGFEEAIFSV